MATWQRRLIGLAVPCLLAWAVDVGLTLHGQPAEYWAGDYTQTTEGAPFYRRLYAWHPAAAVVGHLAWAGLLCGLLVLLPEVAGVVLAIAGVFGHTAGAYAWIVAALLRAHGPSAAGWYQIANGLFLLSAAVVGVGVHWSVRSAALHPSVEPRRLPEATRWALIAGLFAAGSAIVFAPW